MAPKPRLLDQVRERLRLKHYSIRTEQAYVDWIKRYILFHGKRHPASMGKEEAERFLTHLAASERWLPLRRIRRIFLLSNRREIGITH